MPIPTIKFSILLLFILLPLFSSSQEQEGINYIVFANRDHTQSGIFLSNQQDNYSTYKFLIGGEYPCISPDGNMLCYIETTKPNGTGKLCIYYLNSKIRKVLTDSNSCTPQWSPDGNHIVYEDWSDNNCRIWVIDTNKSKKKIIAGYKNPSYSPDGKFIAAVRNFDIYILDLQTRKTKKITDTKDRIEKLPAWSPDGKNIAYYTQTTSGNQTSIYYTNLSTGRTTKIVNYLSDRFYWISNNGIMYDDIPEGQHHSQIIFINIDGTHKKVVTNSAIDHYWPSCTRK